MTAPSSLLEFLAGLGQQDLSEEQFAQALADRLKGAKPLSTPHVPTAPPPGQAAPFVTPRSEFSEWEQEQELHRQDMAEAQQHMADAAGARIIRETRKALARRPAGVEAVLDPLIRGAGTVAGAMDVPAISPVPVKDVARAMIGMEPETPPMPDNEAARLWHPAVQRERQFLADIEGQYKMSMAEIDKRISESGLGEAFGQDVYDNILGLQHVLTSALPQDWTAPREESTPENIRRRFEGAFAFGQRVTPAMAGEILTMLDEPLKYARARPASAALVVAPLVRSLIAAGKITPGVMRLHKVAQEAHEALLSRGPKVIEELGLGKAVDVAEASRTRVARAVGRGEAQRTVPQEEFIGAVTGTAGEPDVGAVVESAMARQAARGIEYPEAEYIPGERLSEVHQPALPPKALMPGEVRGRPAGQELPEVPQARVHGPLQEGQRTMERFDPREHKPPPPPTLWRAELTKSPEEVERARVTEVPSEQMALGETRQAYGYQPEVPERLGTPDQPAAPERPPVFAPGAPGHAKKPMPEEFVPDWMRKLDEDAPAFDDPYSSGSISDYPKTLLAESKPLTHAEEMAERVDALKMAKEVENIDALARDRILEFTEGKSDLNLVELGIETLERLDELRHTRPGVEDEIDAAMRAIHEIPALKERAQRMLYEIERQRTKRKGGGRGGTSAMAITPQGEIQWFRKSQSKKEMMDKRGFDEIEMMLVDRISKALKKVPLLYEIDGKVQLRKRSMASSQREAANWLEGEVKRTKGGEVRPLTMEEFGKIEAQLLRRAQAHKKGVGGYGEIPMGQYATLTEKAPHYLPRPGQLRLKSRVKPEHRAKPAQQMIGEMPRPIQHVVEPRVPAKPAVKGEPYRPKIEAQFIEPLRTKLTPVEKEVFKAREHVEAAQAFRRGEPMKRSETAAAKERAALEQQRLGNRSLKPAPRQAWLGWAWDPERRHARGKMKEPEKATFEVTQEVRRWEPSEGRWSGGGAPERKTVGVEAKIPTPESIRVVTEAVRRASPKTEGLPEVVANEIASITAGELSNILRTPSARKEVMKRLIPKLMQRWQEMAHRRATKSMRKGFKNLLDEIAESPTPLHVLLEAGTKKARGSPLVKDPNTGRMVARETTQYIDLQQEIAGFLLENKAVRERVQREAIISARKEVSIRAQQKHTRQLVDTEIDKSLKALGQKLAPTADTPTQAKGMYEHFKKTGSVPVVIPAKRQFPGITKKGKQTQRGPVIEYNPDDLIDWLVKEDGGRQLPDQWRVKKLVRELKRYEPVGLAGAKGGRAGYSWSNLAAELLGLKQGERVWMPRTMKERLGWFQLSLTQTRSNHPWHVFHRWAKVGLTGRNPTAHLNNSWANVALQAISRANPFTLVNLARFGAKYKKWIKDELTGQDKEILDGIEATSTLSSTLLQAEVGAVDRAGIPQILGRIPVVGKAVEGALEKTLGPVNRALEKGYHWGDNIFKGEQQYHTHKILDRWLSNLKDGEWAELEITDRRWVRVRKEGGEFKVGDKTLSPNELLMLKARAAKKRAMDLFIEYPNTPNYIKFMQTLPILNSIAPFMTWAYMTLDIPGVKRGFMYRLLQGDLPHVRTSSRAINSEMAKAHFRTAGRMGMALASWRALLSQFPKAPESLQKSLQYEVADIGMAITKATKEPNWVEHNILDSKNPLSSDFAAVGAMQWVMSEDDEELAEKFNWLFPRIPAATRDGKPVLIQGPHWERGVKVEGGAPFQPDVLDTKLKHWPKEVRERMWLWRDKFMREATGMKGNMSQLMRLGGFQMAMYEEIFSDIHKDAKQGKTFGDVEQEKAARTIGSALAGATVEKAVRLVPTIWGDGAPGTQWQRDQLVALKDTETIPYRQGVLQLVIRDAFGLGAKYVETDQAWKRFTSGLRSEFRKRLIKPLDDFIFLLGKQRNELMIKGLTRKMREAREKGDNRLANKYGMWLAAVQQGDPNTIAALEQEKAMRLQAFEWWLEQYTAQHKADMKIFQEKQ